MDKIRKALKGYKTYLIAAAGILTCVVAWATGEIELPAAADRITALVLAMTGRAAIGKL